MNQFLFFVSSRSLLGEFYWFITKAVVLFLDILSLSFWRDIWAIFHWIMLIIFIIKRYIQLTNYLCNNTWVKIFWGYKRSLFRLFRSLLLLSLRCSEVGHATGDCRGMFKFDVSNCVFTFCWKAPVKGDNMTEGGLSSPLFTFSTPLFSSDDLSVDSVPTRTKS